MDPILYKYAQDGTLGVLRQYNNQLHEQLDPNKNNLLHVSAQFHDSAKFVDKILNDTQSSRDKRSMLTWKNSEGETALHIASRNRRSNIVQVLIQHAQALDLEELESGVKICEKMMRALDQNGDTALHLAVRNNHKEVAELLLTKDPHFKHPGNEMKETPLYLAIERHYHDIVNSILTICTSQNFEGPDGKTALHAAVLARCSNCITKILEKNPTLAGQADETGWIPLHYAAYYYYDTSPLKYLLNADRSTAYVRTSKDDNKTAMHIAVCRGNVEAMEELLNCCLDCWVMVTNKGQNVLHLVVENEEPSALEFILRQKWAINLINQKDAEGNTPLHLYVKDGSEDFDASSLLDLKHPLVDWNAVNKENFTLLDLLFMPGKLELEYLGKEAWSLYWKLRGAGAKRGARKLTSIDTEKRNRDERKQRTQRWREENKQRTQKRLKELRERAGTHLLVATLIATVTFAAGFTLPGGYDGNQGDNQGMAVLIRKEAFKTFVVTDTIAVMSSITAVFLHFSATFYQDEDKLYDRHMWALILIVIAMMTMVIAFITGLYTVLQHGSSALAITVCVVGCFAILVFCYMIQRDVRETYMYLFEE